MMHRAYRGLLLMGIAGSAPLWGCSRQRPYDQSDRGEPPAITASYPVSQPADLLEQGIEENLKRLLPKKGPVPKTLQQPGDDPEIELLIPGTYRRSDQSDISFPVLSRLEGYHPADIHGAQFLVRRIDGQYEAWYDSMGMIDTGWGVQISAPFSLVTLPEGEYTIEARVSTWVGHFSGKNVTVE